MPSYSPIFGQLFFRLQNYFLAPKRCPSKLSFGYSSPRTARSWSCVLFRYLALRFLDACYNLFWLALISDAGTFSPKIPRYEDLPITCSGRVGHRHGGRPAMKDVEKDLQSRIQCKLFDDLNVRHRGRDCKVKWYAQKVWRDSGNLPDKRLEGLFGFWCNWKGCSVKYTLGVFDRPLIPD